MHIGEAAARHGVRGHGQELRLACGARRQGIVVGVDEDRHRVRGASALRQEEVDVDLLAAAGELDVAPADLLVGRPLNRTATEPVALEPVLRLLAPALLPLLGSGRLLRRDGHRAYRHGSDGHQGDDMAVRGKLEPRLRLGAEPWPALLALPEPHRAGRAAVKQEPDLVDPRSVDVVWERHVVASRRRDVHSVVEPFPGSGEVQRRAVLRAGHALVAAEAPGRAGIEVWTGLGRRHGMLVVADVRTAVVESRGVQRARQALRLALMRLGAGGERYARQRARGAADAAVLVLRIHVQLVRHSAAGQPEGLALPARAGIGRGRQEFVRERDFEDIRRLGLALEKESVGEEVDARELRTCLLRRLRVDRNANRRARGDERVLAQGLRLPRDRRPFVRRVGVLPDSHPVDHEAGGELASCEVLPRLVPPGSHYVAREDRMDRRGAGRVVRRVVGHGVPRGIVRGRLRADRLAVEIAGDFKGRPPHADGVPAVCGTREDGLVVPAFAPAEAAIDVEAVVEAVEELVGRVSNAKAEVLEDV